MSKDNVLDILLMREALERTGFFVGSRDPKRNTDYEGEYMVCDTDCLDLPESRDAAGGLYCVVGPDLDELTREAYYHHDLDDPEVE
jgi:hypothetical protein